MFSSSACRKFEFARYLCAAQLPVLALTLSLPTQVTAAHARGKQALSSQTEICNNLQFQFDSNEYWMAFYHDINAHAVESEREHRSTTRGTDNGFLLAKKKLDKEDEERRLKGDRITTLLAANGCAPPDHVTGWYTYSEKNPHRKPRPF